MKMYRDCEIGPRDTSIHTWTRTRKDSHGKICKRLEMDKLHKSQSDSNMMVDRPVLSPRLVHSDAAARTSGDRTNRKRCKEIRKELAQAQLAARQATDREDPAYSFEKDVTAEVLLMESRPLSVPPEISEEEDEANILPERLILEDERTELHQVQGRVSELNKQLRQMEKKFLQDSCDERLVLELDDLVKELWKEKNRIGSITKQSIQRQDERRGKLKQLVEKMETTRKKNLYKFKDQGNQATLGEETRRMIEARAERFGREISMKVDDHHQRIERQEKREQGKIQQLGDLIEYIGNEFPEPETSNKKRPHTSLGIRLDDGAFDLEKRPPPKTKTPKQKKDFSIKPNPNASLLANLPWSIREPVHHRKELKLEPVRKVRK